MATTSSEAGDEAMREALTMSGEQGCYYRFGVNIGMEIQLHEFGNTTNMRDTTTRYLQDVSSHINTCARKLNEENAVPVSHPLTKSLASPSSENTGGDLTRPMTAAESHDLI